jgi:hypothetical protein
MRRLIMCALGASLAAAGCTVEPAVSPLPTEVASVAVPLVSSATPPRSASRGPASRGPASHGPASASPTVSPRGPRRSVVPTRTTRPRVPEPTTPASSSSCQGAVVRTIDVASDELALVPALCLGRGAVLRVENIGPGEVTTDSPDLVDQNYEAGVVEIRFLRAGTVVVTIPQAGESYDVAVVVR